MTYVLELAFQKLCFGERDIMSVDRVFYSKMVTWQGKRSSALVVRIQEDTIYRFIGVKTLVLMSLLYLMQNPTLDQRFLGVWQSMLKLSFIKFS